MRIGIDVRHLSRGPFTGVAEVSRCLIEGLTATPGHEIRIFYSGRASPPSSIAILPDKHKDVSFKAFHFPNRLLDVCLELFGLPKVDALLGGVDVFFSPHALLTPLSSPRVLILHDLSFVVRPDFFSPQSRIWHLTMRIKQQARQASRLIVPSRATADDLQYYWKIGPEKIAVIPWGAPSIAENIRREERSGRTVLFIGTVEKRKNVVGLVRAFSILKRDMRFSDVKLIIAGTPGWGSEEVAKAVKASGTAKDIAMLGYVSAEEKTALWRSASIFVYPSLYEGFGLPVLEAMAVGVPVVTSRVTSLPEVSGDAAMLINPRNVEDMAEAMKMLLEDNALQAELSRRGLERAKQFSWARTTQQVLAVLQDVVNAKVKGQNSKAQLKS